MKKSFTVRLLAILFAFFVTDSAFATKYYSKATGDLDDPNTWGDAAVGDGTGTSPILADYTSGNIDTFVVANRTAFAHIKGWTLNSNKVVIIGNGLTAITLSVQGTNGSIVGGAKIDVSNLGHLLLGRATALSIGASVLNSLANTSTVSYNAAGGSSVIAHSSYANLSILANSTMTGVTVVFGALTLNTNRSLTMGSQTLSIQGTIAGTGSLSTNNTSMLNIGGSGTSNIGTLKFSGVTPVVNRMNISFISSSGIVTLGSNITTQDNGVLGTSFFNYDTGSLDLNGFNVTVDANSDANFPPSAASGGLIGSSSSSLKIFGTVGVAGGGTALYMSSTNNTLKSLLVSNAGAFMSLGNGLVITDSISVHLGELTTNGNLTLTSTSTLKGRLGLIDNNNGAFLFGDVTVETFIPGSTTGWANLGTPGIGGQTFASWDTYPTTGGSSGIPMTCTGCIYDPSVVGGFESIQGWSEAANNYITGLTQGTSIDVGTGYWVYVGNGTSTTTALKLRNTGPPSTGIVNVGLTTVATGTNKGSNLIANPFASPISWAKVLLATGSASAGVANAIYIWNADLGVTTSYVSGSSSPGGASTSANDVIPAGQAFYVTTNSATTLVFDESCKVASNTGSNPLLRPTNNYGKIFQLKLEGTTGEWDATNIRLHQDATSDFDNEWDAKKVFQSPGYQGYPGPYTKYTTISSKDPFGKDYSTNSIPLLTQSLTISVLAKVSTTGSYTISGLDVSDLSDCVMLHDKLLDKTQDLKMGSYSFTINDTTSAARFELLLCKEKADETGIKQQYTNADQVLISKDVNGAFVKTSFDHSTKAVISVYNLIGQKLCEDIAVEGTETITRLNLGSANQIVFVKVTTATETYTKKFLVQ